MLAGGGRSTELRLLRVMDGRSGSLLPPIILCVRSFPIGRKCSGEEDADGCMDATGQYAAKD